jgi:hypothetical protein
MKIYFIEFGTQSAKKFQGILGAFRTSPLTCQPHQTVTRHKKIQADWLPQAEKVTASVSRSEASDMAKDIFDSWVKLVRKSIP